jgi:glycine cleavage system H protein
MKVPADRKYLESHEWLRADGDQVTVGITQLAADQLSDVTFVQLPQVGTEVVAGRPFGEIESVKATSELYAGVSGRVMQVNSSLADHPELVNTAPFDAGWMIKIAASDLGELEKLWTARQYEDKYGEQG